MHLFHVPGLTCGSCLGFVTRALHSMDPAARIEADLPSRTIRVISARFESALLRALREARYAADPVLQAWG